MVARSGINCSKRGRTTGSKQGRGWTTGIVYRVWFCECVRRFGRAKGEGRGVGNKLLCGWEVVRIDVLGGIWNALEGRF